MKSGWANGWRGIFALALLTGAASTRAQAPPGGSVTAAVEEEPKIVAIRMVKEDGQELSNTLSGIAVETGKTLDPGKIADSLRALYRTGDYADLRAVVTPVADGVRLDFVVRENLFFNQVRIAGLTAPPSEASAAAAMQLTLGQTCRQAAVSEALERLRETLREEGLYQAEVSAETVPHPEAHQMDIVVHVKPGPRARVGIIQLRNGTEYRDADVKYTTETHEMKSDHGAARGTEEVITYTVERGVRHKLMGIEITGNRYFDTELLRSRLQVFGGAFGSAGRFSRRLVDSDTQSMRTLYQANGFLDATVEQQTEDNYKGKQGDLFIRFVIQEGKQTRVASLSMEGNHVFKEDELLGVVGSTPGQPYSDFSVTTDRDNILALYFNEGFPEASFTATAERVSRDPAAQKADPGRNTVSSEKKQKKERTEKESLPAIEQAEAVRLVYHIQEGPQTRVRRILIGGYEHTRPGVIRREVHIKVKEPLREGDVVESQRRLYNLGVFNRVTIEPQNPNGTNPEKDVAVLVEEAKRYTLAYGGGFEVQRLASTTSPTGAQIEAAPRGILELSKLNLTGRGDSLSLKLRGSTLQGRALLGYSAPNTFANPHFSFQATAFAEKTRDINTFTEDRYEGSVQLTEQVTPLTTVLYRYAFRKVQVSNLKILSEEVPLFNQPTLVSQFGVTWFRDSRDSPAEASKGSFNSADFSDADTKVGSSASFLRFFFQNSTYYPIKRRFSFARSTRLGFLLPYRDTVSLSFPAPAPGQCTAGTAPSGPSPTIIPLPERFFAGGGTSLRGFALNQAGPRDACTGFPVGGQAMLVLNQEFRFPMRLPFIGTSLGGAIFYDGGNVYSRLSRISLHSMLPEPTFALQNLALPAGSKNVPE